MFKNSAYLLCICTFFYSYSCLASIEKDNTFNIIVSADVKNDYLLFLKGRDPLTITEFSGGHSRRDVVEIILVEQALHFGGNRHNYNLISSNSSRETIQRLYEGSVLLTGSSVWQSMFIEQDNIYFSVPVINNGQFESGLYTHPDNKSMLAVKNLKQLQQQGAISNKSWSIDWYTLQSLAISKIWHAERWSSMVEMVNSQQADFLLAPFQPTEDLSIQVNGIKLVPVPNVKIALSGTRHFAISKKAKNSKQILQQLNRGLYILKTQGIIKRAYKQSGFFNNKVKDWKRLN
jgi:hypothetical protein